MRLTTTASRISLSLTLLAAVAGSSVAIEPSDTKYQEQAGEQLTGWDVLARAAEARGGAARIGEITSVEFTGEFRIPRAGILATLVRVEAPANNFAMHCDAGSMGSLVQVTDGDSAWLIEPGIDRTETLERNDRHDVLRMGDFFVLGDAESYYESATVVGTEEINGNGCTRVELESFSGDSTVGFYDNTTGHRVKLLAHRSISQEGLWDVEVTYHDWAEHDGVVIPMRIAHRRKRTDYEIEYETVEFDVELSGNEFNDPGEI